MVSWTQHAIALAIVQATLILSFTGKALAVREPVLSQGSATVTAIYRLVDREGRVTYTDHVPPDEGIVEITRLRVGGARGLKDDSSPGGIRDDSRVHSGEGSNARIEVSRKDGGVPLPGGSASTASGAADGSGAPGITKAPQSAPRAASAGQSAQPSAPLEPSSQRTAGSAKSSELDIAARHRAKGAAEPQPAQVQPSSPLPSASGQTYADGFLVGVNTHYGQTRTELELGMARLSELGVTTFRDAAFWSMVEKAPGQLAFAGQLRRLDDAIAAASQRGLEPLIILAYSNVHYDGGGLPRSLKAQEAFARYAAFVAARYKGVVKQYEIWNEWNIAFRAQSEEKKWGDPAVYAALLKRTYRAMKAVDPDIVVIGGAVAGWDDQWSEEFFAAGGLAYMDAFSVHPYSAPGEPERAIAWLARLQALIQHYSPSREVPILVTEMGWPTQKAEGGVDEERAADFLSRFYLLAQSILSIKGVWWYELQNRGWDEAEKQDNFGLLNGDYSYKPAFCALREIAGILEGASFVAVEQHGSSVWVAKYRKREGGAILAVWSSDPATALEAVILPSSSGQPMASVSAVCRDATYYISEDGGIRITVGQRPHLIHALDEDTKIFIVQ